MHTGVSKDTKISALINLLQDENPKVVSLAMEQFLKLGHEAQRAIAEHQETHDPKLRHRIHQLSSILMRRQARVQFLGAVEREEMSLWDGICQINLLYDFQCNLGTVDKAVTEIVEGTAEGLGSTPRVASLMRQHEFLVPEEDLLDVDLYLAESVIETKYGSPALLCALAQHVGWLKSKWLATVVLHEGRFCLIDDHNMLLDPMAEWNIVKLDASDKIHPCSRRDVWMGVLSQLFLVALVEGQLRDLYHFGDLLTALNDTGLDALPFPLGSN